MIFNTKRKGLNTLFKPYQIILIEYLWSQSELGLGVNSAQAHSYLGNFPENKSRACVIHFLDDMVEEGILYFKSETCKGGYRRIYYPKMNKNEFAEYISEIIKSKLQDVFPNITYTT